MIMKTQTILLNQTISQVKGNIVSDMAGEKVMLSIKNGKYYNLGEIGGDIWDLIEEPISINQLVSTLMNQYEINQSECEEQVISFLEHLLSEELVIIH
ncbi:lasso peptide biosynthesis PqqD family chaperone [Neobacillus vireti]|uniref:lasso peptide biosynthesis PqqD family chaperone n=1 Tax=Neobacillus vireti TaxID=220686 RepID=UPI003000F738